MRSVMLLSILMVLAAACEPAGNAPALVSATPPSLTAAAISPSQAPVTLPTGTTVQSSPPTRAQPTRYLKFPDLVSLQKAALFPVWVPGFIPEHLPLSGAWVADYPDGSEMVSIMYAEPGDPLDANRKVLAYWMTETNETVSRYSVSHQFKINALDVREVNTRGQTGFTYWTRSVAAGNSAVLTWRESGFNLQISLLGAWPQPDEGNPHGLDSILLRVAASLQPLH